MLDIARMSTQGIIILALAQNSCKSSRLLYSRSLTRSQSQSRSFTPPEISSSSVANDLASAKKS